VAGISATNLYWQGQIQVVSGGNTQLVADPALVAHRVQPQGGIMPPTASCIWPVGPYTRSATSDFATW